MLIHREPPPQEGWGGGILALNKLDLCRSMKQSSIQSSAKASSWTLLAAAMSTVDEDSSPEDDMTSRQFANYAETRQVLLDLQDEIMILRMRIKNKQLPSCYAIHQSIAQIRRQSKFLRQLCNRCT